MDESSGHVAAVYLMVQSAFREWREAEDKAMVVGRQILNAASRVEVERLSQLLEDAQRVCVGAWSRFISATHAYSDSLLSAPDAASVDVRQ
jgi:hypothetical protein